MPRNSRGRALAVGEIRHSHRTPSRPDWTSDIAGSTTRLEIISLTTGTTGLVLSWTVKRCHVIARVEPRTVIRAVHRTLSWPGQTYDDRLRQIQRLITSHTTINNCLHQIDNCLQQIRRLIASDLQRSTTVYNRCNRPNRTGPVKGLTWSRQRTVTVTDFSHSQSSTSAITWHRLTVQTVSDPARLILLRI